MSYLCLACGRAMNSVANAKTGERTPFNRLLESEGYTIDIIERNLNSPSTIRARRPPERSWRPVPQAS